MNSKIGYARISTCEQNFDLQIDALENEGCEKIFKDIISGAKDERPGIEELIHYIRPGDTLVVWRLDRLGRTMKFLINFMNDLEKEGIHFKSITEGIDTDTIGGKLTYHLFGALAEFERNVIRERSIAGQTAARARGVFGGRPIKLDPEKQKVAFRLYDSGTTSVKQICSFVGISKPTFYKYLKERKT